MKSKDQRLAYGLSVVMPRSTYGSSHWSPTSRLDKTAVFFMWRFTCSCCQTAYCWKLHLPCHRRLHMERPTSLCHLSTISAHLQKTTKTASVL